MSLFDEGFPQTGFPACTTDDERFARLQLSRTPRIGPVHFQQLIRRFGSAAKVIEALPTIARRAGGAIQPAKPELVEAEIARGRASGARLVVLGDADYPQLLAQIPAAPPVLWIVGAHTAFPSRAVAIVGARNASAAGQKIAHQLAAQLGEAGYLIVSGLARGIDTQAHHASLKTGTVAVLGGGIDDIYPPENTDLYQSIKAYGALISENPVGYKARAGDFPRRNRLISGLSMGVIVVEAELRSGSLITARLAGEQGRNVFAVPGSPLDPRCRGTNGLLREGATLCETAADVLEVLEAQTGFSEAHHADAHNYRVSNAFGGNDFAHMTDEALETTIDSLRDRIFHLISLTPTSRDELLRLAQAPAHAGFAALGELEIAGVITQTHNGHYVRA
ncbi:MAG: DNA-processing protein DprA [Asticcacaulis sp.]